MKKLTFPDGHQFTTEGEGIKIMVNGKEPTITEVLTEENKKVTIKKENGITKEFKRI